MYVSKKSNDCQNTSSVSIQHTYFHIKEHFNEWVNTEENKRWKRASTNGVNVGKEMDREGMYILNTNAW